MDINQVICSLAKEELRFYLKVIRPDFKSPDFQLDLFRRLEKITDSDKHLMVFMPPGHGKSVTISQIFPSWYLGNNPTHNVILATYGQSLTDSHARQVRNIMQTEEFASVFETRLSKDSTAKTKFNTVEGGGLFGTSVSSSLTGYRGDLMIIDDPIKDPSEALNEAHQEKIYNWYQTVFKTRRKKNTKFIILQTLWSLSDLPLKLLEKEPDKWDVVKYPAINDDNEALWPEMFPLSELEDIKKDMSATFWNSLYQQSPVAIDGNLFKREWFNYYKSDQFPTRPDRYIQCWDLTFKESGTSFVVGSVWAKHQEKIYLVDLVRGKWGFDETVKQIVALSDKYPQAFLTYIEDKANGPAIIDHLKKKCNGLTAWSPGVKSKEERALAVEPFLVPGNLYIPKDEMFSDDFLTEAMQFPNGKYDDQVDVMTMALSILGGKNYGSSRFAVGANRQF